MKYNKKYRWYFAQSLQEMELLESIFANNKTSCACEYWIRQGDLLFNSLICRPFFQQLQGRVKGGCGGCTAQESPVNFSFIIHKIII